MRRAATILVLVLAFPDAAFATASPVEHFEAGRAKYDAGDFSGAIASWEAARGEMQSAEPRARALMELNLATAYERAYDANGDRAALESAAQLTRSYIDRAPSAFGPDELAIEQQRGRDRLARIEGKLASAPAIVTTPTLDGPPSLPAEPGPDQPEPQDKPGRGLIGGGAALLGFGVAGLGVMTTGMVLAVRANDFSELDRDLDRDEREAQIRRGNLGNTLSIAGIVTAGVLVPTGIALLAAGSRRKKKAGGTQAHVGPAVGPRHGGVTIRGRF